MASTINCPKLQHQLSSLQHSPPHSDLSGLFGLYFLFLRFRHEMHPINETNKSSIKRLRHSRIPHRALPFLLLITSSPIPHLRLRILVHHRHGRWHDRFILRQVLLQPLPPHPVLLSA